MDIRNTRTTILNEGNPEQKRSEIREYFHKTYDIDERLYETLKMTIPFTFEPTVCVTR